MLASSSNQRRGTSYADDMAQVRSVIIAALQSLEGRDREVEVDALEGFSFVRAFGE